MTSDEEFTVAHYRASLEDVGTPGLDQKILAAAHRRVVQRRVMRMSGGVIAVVGIVLVSIHATSHRDTPPSVDVTDFGVIEGATRSYLLQVQPPAYSGAGLNEGRE
jgi:hypothetical protein